MDSQVHDRRQPAYSRHSTYDGQPSSPKRTRPPTGQRHRSAAHYSTSRSPLRGRSRHTSAPRSAAPGASTAPHHQQHRRSHSGSGSGVDRRSPRRPKAARPSQTGKTPFHAGLHDILHGLFGQGEQGPRPEDLSKLADDFGDLIVTELVDRLVVELKEGLVEKLLLEYLTELVSGTIRKKVGGMFGDGKGKGKDGKQKRSKTIFGGMGGKGGSGKQGSEDDWKKGVLKKAALTLVKHLAQ